MWVGKKMKNREKIPDPFIRLKELVLSHKNKSMPPPKYQKVTEMPDLTLPKPIERYIPFEKDWKKRKMERSYLNPRHGGMILNPNWVKLKINQLSAKAKKEWNEYQSTLHIALSLIIIFFSISLVTDTRIFLGIGVIFIIILFIYPSSKSKNNYLNTHNQINGYYQYLTGDRL